MYRFTYKNEEYYYNPENPIITGMDPDTGEMLEGDKLRNVLGMTDEDMPITSRRKWYLFSDLLLQSCNYALLFQALHFQ